MWTRYTIFANKLNAQREKLRSIYDQIISGRFSTGNADTDAKMKVDIENYMAVFDNYYEKAVVINGGDGMDYNGNPFTETFYDKKNTAYHGLHVIKEYGDTILKAVK